MNLPSHRLALLGATGSIGTQTLDVVHELRGQGQELEVVALAAGKSVSALAQLARAWGVRYLGVAGPEEARALEAALGPSIRVVYGPEGLEELASLPEVDLVVNAVVGAAGLRATLAALRAGKTLALANKESLVTGGELILRQLQRPDQILPVDSEHAALFQILQGVRREEVASLWLTASGGPFRDWPPDKLSHVTPAQALAHPTWKMGPRITVDSATLVNKAFEVIEAHHLFGVPWDRLQVVLHPQSRVHALVELVDGSMLAQLSAADMRIPIRAALTYPHRVAPPVARLSLVGETLQFGEVDRARYPGFWTVLQAGREGGTAPAVANAADEVLVEAFLGGKVPFTAIAQGIQRVLEQHRVRAAADLETILEADGWARHQAQIFVDNACWGL